ncbi:MAG: radical SAM protein [Candidatus Omnitrophota bacterium]
MKILFLNPLDIHTAWPVRNDFARYLFSNPGVTFPLLAALVPLEHEVFYFDGFYDSLTIPEYKKLVQKYDVIVLSIMDSLVSLNYEITIKIIKKICPQKPIIAGGIHANVYARQWLERGVDIIVKREAEGTFFRLIKASTHKNDWQNLADIPGLIYQAAGQIIDTGDYPLLDDLDCSPLPNWGIIDFKLYDLMLSQKGFSASIETSRGCINDCNFCLVNSFWEKQQRYKSLPRVKEELKILKNLGVSQLAIVDDGFANDINRDSQLIEMMLSERFDFSWGAFLRIDTIINNPGFIDFAARSGLKRIIIGFEHTNPRVLTRINKGLDNSTRDQGYFKAIKVLKKYNIFVTGLFISGIPGLKQTEKLKYSVARKYCTDARAGNYKAFPTTYGYKNITQDFEIDDLFYHDARLTCSDESSTEHFLFNLFSTFDPIKYLFLLHPQYHFRRYFQKSIILLFYQMLQVNLSKIKEYLIMKNKSISVKAKKEYLVKKYLSDKFIDKLLKVTSNK